MKRYLVLSMFIFVAQIMIGAYKEDYVWRYTKNRLVELNIEKVKLEIEKLKAQKEERSRLEEQKPRQSKL